MQVVLECHGVFRTLCGGDEVGVQVMGAQADIATVLAALAKQIPAAADYLPRTACARGDQLVARSEMVVDGDRLALIPPVSGGQP